LRRVALGRRRAGVQHPDVARRFRQGHVQISLQGNNPQVGTPNVISADTPTNIYFFIASWRPN
jgi:hypothetical protein